VYRELSISSYISRESYTTRNVLWSRAYVCLSVSVCLSAAACLHYCTDPDVTWRSGRGCPHWAHLQSVHGLRCYGNITRTGNVSEYMLVVALCLVSTVTTRVCGCCAGPDFWGLVNPEWYVCTKGKRQSPINIDPQTLLFDANLRALRIDKHRVSHASQRSAAVSSSVTSYIAENQV